MKAMGEPTNEPYLMGLPSPYTGQVAMALANAGPAFTMISDEGVVGCGGVAIVWAGMGKGWAVFTKIAEKYPVAVVKVTKKVIAKAMHDHGLQRVETTIASNSEKNMRFAVMLGFRREGTLVKYYNGLDFEMVAIT